jgi:hypothetical protein
MTIVHGMLSPPPKSLVSPPPVGVQPGHRMREAPPPPTPRSPFATAAEQEHDESQSARTLSEVHVETGATRRRGHQDT